MENWLDPVYDSRGMGAADNWATEEGGVPSLDLMERAAALAYIGKNVDPAVFGEVALASDVVFGHWNEATKLFTAALGD